MNHGIWLNLCDGVRGTLLEFITAPFVMWEAEKNNKKKETKEKMNLKKKPYEIENKTPADLAYCFQKST